MRPQLRLWKKLKHVQNRQLSMRWRLLPILEADQKRMARHMSKSSSGRESHPRQTGQSILPSAIIEPYTSLSGSSNFSGNRTKDATPRRTKGEPNLLLWKDGPILCRLIPAASKTREDQRMASSTTMDFGCTRDSCVFLAAEGAHHLIARLDSYTGHRWLAAHKQLGG